MHSTTNGSAMTDYAEAYRFTDDDVIHLKDAIAERLRQSGVEVGPTFGVYHPVLRTSGEVHFRVATDCSMANLKVGPDRKVVPAFALVSTAITHSYE